MTMNVINKFKTLLGGVNEVRVILRNDPCDKEMCAIYSADTGYKIGTMDYKTATSKFTNVVVDNYHESSPSSDFFTLSDIQSIVKKEHGIELSVNNLSRLIREYNNFRMPIGKMSELICSKESERSKFIKFVVENGK